jgi:hypothetical protein
LEGYGFALARGHREWWRRRHGNVARAGSRKELLLVLLSVESVTAEVLDFALSSKDSAGGAVAAFSEGVAASAMMASAAANGSSPLDVLALVVFSACGLESLVSVSVRPFLFWAQAAKEEEVVVVEELDPVQNMGAGPPGGTLCWRVVVLPLALAVATESGGDGGMAMLPGLEAVRSFSLSYSDQSAAIAWI